MNNKKIIEEFKKEFVANGKLVSKINPEDDCVIVPIDKKFVEYILEWIEKALSQQKQEFKRVVEGFWSKSPTPPNRHRIGHNEAIIKILKAIENL